MDEFDDIPESLKRDLKAQPRLDIPAGRDALIKSAARQTLRGRVGVWRSTAWIGAAAAAIAVALFVGLNWHPAANAPTGPRVEVPKPMPRVNDVNGDGTVDIRDALILAQRLKAKEQIVAPWNPKVTLDQSSLDAIIDQIVSVSPAPSAAAPDKRVPATFAVVGIELPAAGEGTVRR